MTTHIDKKRSRSNLSLNIERKKFRRLTDSSMRFKEQQNRRERDKAKAIEQQTLKIMAMRSINQFSNPSGEKELEMHKEISLKFQEDVKTFRSLSYRRESAICSVCGTRSSMKDITKLNDNDSMFLPLQRATGEEYWPRYNVKTNAKTNDRNLLNCCACCTNALKKGNVPKLSRVNIPLSNVSDVLRSLTYLESLLLSPILPMTNVWRHQNFGQYKTRGQCVAFLHDVSEIATHLPRHPCEVLVNVEFVYGWKGSIRLESIRKAFFELKYLYCHPSFKNIRFSKENYEALKNVIMDSEQNHEKEKQKMSDMNDVSNETCSEELLNRGMNQYIDNYHASSLLGAPIACEEHEPELSDLKEKILKMFNDLRNRTIPLHYTDKTTDWAALFPTLLPSGKGGPIGEFIPISLREWIKYVIQIESLPFHCSIPFIFYGNFILRKYKITGVSTCKPISDSISKAISELVKIAKNRSLHFISESVIRSLTNQISLHTTTLQGSVGDMSCFRKDMFTMMSKHGAPTYFITLSPADTYWLETYARISHFESSLEEIGKLSSHERSELLASSPVLATLAWKERLDAMINFLCNGKLKPLGKVLHYAIKTEWQTRCSEHAHLLLWCETSDENLNIQDLSRDEIENNVLLRNAEANVSTWIPKTFNDSCSGTGRPRKKVIEDLVSSIQSEPIEDFTDFFESMEKQNHICQLIEATQIHQCNRYCTRGYTSDCKSNFPFPKIENSVLKVIEDHMGTKQYRILTRRNHERVNSFNTFILNLWRANMDITRIIGDPFGAVVYIALYTSKVDKKNDITDVLKKLKHHCDDGKVSTTLRKVLMSLESGKAVGAAEASSNLLGYSHWRVSSTVIRISTIPYLLACEKITQGNMDSTAAVQLSEDADISDSFGDLLTGNDDFDIKNKEKMCANKANEVKFCTSCMKYFDRPLELEDLSLQDYIQEYKVTRKKSKLPNELRDIKNRVVSKRGNDGETDVIVDLKYRVSPPSPDDEKWCVGALILHVPHRNVEALLSGETNFVNAYKLHYEKKAPSGIFRNEKLHKHEQDESKLYNTMNSGKRPNREKKDSTRNNDDDSSEENDQKDLNVDDIDKNNSESLDFDLEENMTSPTDELKHLPQERPWIAWNGNFSLKYYTKNSMPDFIESRGNYEKRISLDAHDAYMKKLLSGNDMSSTGEFSYFDEAENDISKCSTLAEGFKNRILNECKSEGQRFAFQTITNCLEQYYYGSVVQREKPIFENHDPLFTIVGVPGAGKSWLISNLKKWVVLRIPCSKQPHNLEEEFSYETSQTAVCIHLNDALNTKEQKSYGKAPGIAYSGAAAGIINGYTIHSSLGFSRGDLSHRVLKGIERLKPLSAKKRNALYALFREAKVLFIDEVYTIEAGLLHIIDKRLQQIFGRNQPFGGLPVILVGDPRQIVPVTGKPLFFVSKYITFKYSCNNEENPYSFEVNQNECRKDNITLADIEGYKLYSQFMFHAPLNESIRLSESTYAQLNQAAASYSLTKDQIDTLNDTFYKPHNELYSSPWLDAVWIFPTWILINEHLRLVADHMGKTKGIFRIWTRVLFQKDLANDASIKRKRKALSIFLTEKWK